MDPDATEVFQQFPAAAEYLTGILILHRDYGTVSNTQVAAWLGVTSPAVTQSLGRLKKLGLVKQKRYGDIFLTEEGATMARAVLRRHYLLEHLLVDALDYPWEKADEEAKRLQGMISDDLTEHMFVRFGRPETCPHGNPLPGSSVEKRLLSAPRLCDATPGSTIRILRITEEGEGLPHMLEMCHAAGIKPGALFDVTAIVGGTVRLSPRAAAGRGEASLPLSNAAHVRYEEYS